MKVYIDGSDYIEAKNDGRGSVDLSIRTSSNEKKSIIITAKLDSEVLDKLISNLIILKSKVISEEKRS